MNTAAVIHWRKRPDLIQRQHDSGGWIIKDPLALNYLLLSDPEWCILNILDGKSTVSDIQQHLHAIHPHQVFESAEIIDLVNQLIAGRLIVPSALHHFRPEQKPAAGRATRQLAAVNHIFRIRIRLFDPTPLLGRLHRWIHAVFSPAGAIGAGLLVAVALLLILLRFDRVAAELRNTPDFFGARNLTLLFFSFVTVKALHELGHACAAYRYQVTCREAGVMLLFFTPLLYTNVTDSWMVDRRRRLLITGAGVMAELVVAAVCTILWNAASPGVTRSLLFNTMILCSVSTLAFNGNPLLRYDGYFLFSDAVGRPNLAMQAAAGMRRGLEQLLLGPDRREGVSPDAFLLSYGLLSAVYRIVLTVAILSMLIRMAHRWHVSMAGVVLAVFAAVALLALPAFGMLQSLTVAVFSRPNRFISLLRCTLLMLIPVCVAVVPLPCSIVVPGVIEPSGTPVYNTLPGQLQSHVPYGSAVTAGDNLGTLADPDAERELLKLRGEAERQELLVRTLELRRQPDDASQLPAARELLLAMRNRCQHLQEQFKRYQISAPVSGVLMPPRYQQAPDDDLLLPGWSSLPLDPANQGALISPGTLLGFVGDSQNRDLLILLREQEVRQLRPDQRVRLLPAAIHFGALSGTIRQISALPIEEIPQELLIAGTVRPPSDRTAGVRGPFWTALVSVHCDSDQPIPLYTTASARIGVASMSISQRMWRYLRSTFTDETGN